MASPQLNQLLNVLKDRDISLHHDDVAWAFESTKTHDAMTNWTKEYLDPACLLTTEELRFLDTHGLGNNLVETYSHCITDEDILSAITTLEASTEAIVRQSRILEQQSIALQQLRSRDVPSNDSQTTKATRQGKFRRQRAQINIETSEAISDLQSRLRSLLTKSEVNTAALPTLVEKIFEKDNRLLDGFDKALPVVSGDSDDNPEFDEVHILCDALVALSTAEIHSRMDGVYISATKPSIDQADDRQADQSHEAQADGVRAELEELSKEINGLATMAVDNQYRTPILRAVEAAKLDTANDKSSWFAYLSKAMEYLISRLEILEIHAHQLHAHTEAIKTTATALDAVAALTVENDFPTEEAPLSNRDVSRKGLRPLRLVQANFSDSQDPASQLLRWLDIKTAMQSDPQKFATELVSATDEREKAMHIRAAAAEVTISDLLRQSVEAGDADVRHLEQAIYTHSNFGSISLTNHAVLESIDELDEAVQVVGDAVRSIDPDASTKAIQSAQRALLGI